MISTLAIAEDLAAAGVEQKQAKAIANAVGAQNKEIATKDFVRSEISPVRTDVAVLKSDVAVLKSDVAVLKSDVAVLKSDGAAVKAEVATLKWMVGVNMAITLALFASFLSWALTQ